MKSNKTVIITGSNSGIGFELAKKLISEDYFVILACRNRKKGLVAEKRLGIRSKFIEIDLSNYESIDTFSRQIRNERLNINYLVNNAGVAQHGDIETYNDNLLNKIMNTNVDAVFRMCRSAITPMKKQNDGVILNIGSISGLVSNIPQPQVAYNASKAAVHMMTKSLASDYAEHNIRVNAIAPGYIKTDMCDLPEENKHWYPVWNQMTPMGRMGNPEEVAAAALFLCSPASSYVSGEVLVVDGGYTSR